MSDARLFVAVQLPPEACDALAAWGRLCAQADPALRAVAASALHLTLHFLGARPEEEIEPLAAVVSAAVACVAGPVELSLGAALWLAPRRPHVLTCAVDDAGDALAGLHTGLAAPLAAAAPGWKPERRALTPHVTVARVRRGALPKLGAEPESPSHDFTALSLTLLRSRLGGSGARYEVLERAALPRRAPANPRTRSVRG